MTCAEMGVLEPSGRWLPSLDAFKGALRKNQSLLAEVGEVGRIAAAAGSCPGRLPPG